MTHFPSPPSPSPPPLLCFPKVVLWFPRGDWINCERAAWQPGGLQERYLLRSPGRPSGSPREGSGRSGGSPGSLPGGSRGPFWVCLGDMFPGGQKVKVAGNGPIPVQKFPQPFQGGEKGMGSPIFGVPGPGKGQKGPKMADLGVMENPYFSLYM